MLFLKFKMKFLGFGSFAIQPFDCDVMVCVSLIRSAT